MLDAHNDALPSRSSSGSGCWCAAAAEAGGLEDRLRKKSLVHKILSRTTPFYNKFCIEHLAPTWNHQSIIMNKGYM